MKLLIVDDEPLSRDGVAETIRRTEPGITEIFTADDGVNGLSRAKECRPDLILCDIRMPRLDGIGMVSAIREFLPDTAAIFMSGYSDKEYLKAAIRLRAVSYIEKPIQSSELHEALQNAIALRKSAERARSRDDLHRAKVSEEAARRLISPSFSEKEPLGAPLSSLTGPVQAVIVQLDPEQEALWPAPQDAALHLQRELALKDCLFCVRHASYLVFLLFYEKAADAEPERLRPALARLLFGAGRYFAAAGPLAERLDETRLSYEQSVIRLQSSFFFEPGSVLLPGDFEGAPARELPLSPDEARRKLYDALISDRRESVDALTEQIRAYYSENMHVLPTEAKDLYYTLSHAIRDAARQRRILENLSGESFLSAMESCFSFSELHAGLTERIERYFERAGEVQENPVVKGIYDYIAGHYMDEHLSVKAVSDHVFLSASYVCTLFKNETGQTLNHFITSYRMEMAKLLLADLRYTVSEVSSRVGYSDGNYFGKSFKKHCGLSPTEYREKALK